MVTHTLLAVLFLATFAAVASAAVVQYKKLDYYYQYASCDFVGAVDPGMQGTIKMRQQVPTHKYYGVYTHYYPLEIYVEIQLSNNASGIFEHGLHVHTFGDLSNNCSGAGGHYNPLATSHGAPGDPFDKRHIGDWGNVKEVNGTIKTRFLDYLAPLYGPYSIYGRAIVLHAGEDDLGRGGDEGSLATGNAGKRLGCCLVRHIDQIDF